MVVGDEFNIKLLKSINNLWATLFVHCGQIKKNYLSTVKKILNFKLKKKITRQFINLIQLISA